MGFLNDLKNAVIGLFQPHQQIISPLAGNKVNVSPNGPQANYQVSRPTPTPLPGQQAWTAMMVEKNPQQSPAYYNQLYQKATTAPGGHYYNVTPTPISPTPTQQLQNYVMQPAQSFNPQQYAQQLKQGFLKYNHNQPLPIMNYIPYYVQAAQQYPLFQKYPYILPSIGLKESSGGKANAPLMGYGVHVGATDDPQNQILGAAHDISTMGEYQKFRNTGSISDLLNTYAPSNENNTNQYINEVANEYLPYFQ